MNILRLNFPLSPWQISSIRNISMVLITLIEAKWRIYRSLNMVIVDSDDGLSSWPTPSYCLSQCRNIVNWTLGNKFQVNVNLNTNNIEENAFEYVVWNMAAISHQPQCVNMYLDLVAVISHIFLKVGEVVWFIRDTTLNDLCKLASNTQQQR